MHKYQKISFLAVMLSLGISATASAQSFPQDYVNTGLAVETKQANQVETKKQSESNSILSESSFSYHVNMVMNAEKAQRPVQLNSKLIDMSDATSQSDFYLFNRYL
ncbi:hypothetical protein [Methylophaga thiooxydans]|uniref:hypothetical protein n=1 Tax=Methylophaga thiooxydans TaxID=392484 RepID=UPI002357C772|nr:hypothetical protein [Methylophaga thiooxydans]